MEILDIGCGNNPQGSVNVDLFLEPTFHRNLDDQEIKAHKIKNFVKCDASNLPFSDKAFDLAYSHHVLEHLENPLGTLKEWARVARRIRVVVPDLKICRIYGEFEPHLFSWSRWSLQHLLEKVCSNVKISPQKIPLQIRRKNQATHIINFFLKRFFIHFPFLQNAYLVGTGET